MTENGENNHSTNLTKNTLYAVIILLIYTISSSIFKKINFHYIHESGVCMIIGLLVNLFAYFFSPEVKFLSYRKVYLKF